MVTARDPDGPAARASACFPLNSRRLTGPYLVRIAKAMGLPEKGTTDQLRVMIEGKLSELGREAQNIQVSIEQDQQGGETVMLRDASGVFVTVKADATLETGGGDGSGVGGDGNGVGGAGNGVAGGAGGDPGDRESDETAERQLEETLALNQELASENRTLNEMVDALRIEVSDLTDGLKKETERVNDMWRMSCTQVAGFDAVLIAKEAVMDGLKARVRELEATTVSEIHGPPTSALTSVCALAPALSAPPPTRARTLMSPATAIVPSRRGKAPPVNEFNGENPECRLEDWLPTLERACSWNSWTEEEKAIQLAGHLRGRALMEHNLLRPEDRISFEQTVEALRVRLDPGGKAVAAQDFRHTVQADSEAVSDFICRLERTFRIAYGRDTMSSETKDTLLYGQLQEGLRLELMKGPAVSGATKYQELCVAAKNEEKRLVELKRRQQYSRSSQHQPPQSYHGKPQQLSDTPATRPRPSRPERPSDQHRRPTGSESGPEGKTCFRCKKTGHFMRDCPQRKSESSGSGRQARAQQVSTQEKPADTPPRGEPPVSTLEKSADTPPGGEPLDFLFSDSDEEEDVRQVNVTDSGSHCQVARVDVFGVPADGVVDTAADITIMGGKLFAMVAAAARLRKKDFRKPDKVPRTYDRKVFRLDGCMDMEISFDRKAIKTVVYIKMDAVDQLLLSEGVCRQLGMVTYHPAVRLRKTSKGTVPGGAIVPSIRVRLVQSLRLPPSRSAVVPVRLDSTWELKKPLMVEGDGSFERETGLIVEDALIAAAEDGITQLVVTNLSGFTQTVQEGVLVGEVQPADVLKPDPGPEEATHGEAACVRKLSLSREQWRKTKLMKVLDLPEMPPGDTCQLQDFLKENHEVFSLEDGERGETDLVSMEINTEGASPRRQAPRRMPFIVRQEVAKQLEEMQRNGVVEPSSSPWSSPVVMVRKKDGSHRFCVDYRALNAVTKADTFPLPRIDDLLDRLGGARYFTTLDLASGFWQIRVEPTSREKTAFATPHGLYEFLVMPFGLTNAPAVFQRLMQRVLTGLNPEDGKEFVSAYIDDILVFSASLQDHLAHLTKVIDRLREVNLKLKPAKCKFVREEVEYLGHVITSGGLKPNVRLTSAVQEFPRPRNVHEVRRFLGMASYYRRFIPNFARIAQPLHHLTAKNVTFSWSADTESAFTTLKAKLVTPPVLAYPRFGEDFTLETDASIQGLGAVLSQKQEDGKPHPIAYASRALNPAEKNYSVTELETLAVVWAVTHFHSYLYGCRVTVLTDHSAVKAVLETSNPTGKHARWWTRVYGRGVQSVSIVYRAGKENVSADALSRSPRDPAPVEGIAQDETQVAAVAARDVPTLLQADPVPSQSQDHYGIEQRKDPRLEEMMEFLGNGSLPSDGDRAKKLAAQEPLFSLLGDVLYYIDHKRENRKRVAVPQHLREQLLRENHKGLYGGHFAGQRVYNTLVRHWWWEGMYADAMIFCKQCPECAIVTGASRQHRPPLHPIPVERPFQKVGVDIMDLPRTDRGNRHVVVFQDLFTKWPMVFAVPDQKAERIARLLCEEIVPFFGVPEALLSDRGTNLLSHLMLDVCELLGVEKLNTTAYHPECDGMVERLNRTLKTILRKRAAEFGPQWDCHLPGLLWAYRNTPHESTGEKPSFLLFGWDCRSPTEAALLPVSTKVTACSVEDYREELILTLSSAREAALDSIRAAQRRYKSQYDRRADDYQYRVGEWILIRFPSEETGRLRKLSRPWHGPYRIVSCDDTNVTATKVYFPEEKLIQVHQTRVKPCPGGFMAGHYWYGTKRKGPGRPPRWVERVLSDAQDSTGTTSPERVDSAEPDHEDPSPTFPDAHTLPDHNPGQGISDGSKRSEEDGGSRVDRGAGVDAEQTRYPARRNRHPPDRLQQ